MSSGATEATCPFVGPRELVASQPDTQDSGTWERGSSAHVFRDSGERIEQVCRAQ